MASDDSGQNARYALSKQLQRETVAEYERSLVANEDISVVEVISAIDDVFHIGESNEVRSKFGEFSKNKKSVVEVVMGGGEALRIYREKSRGAAKCGRSVLCYVQGNERLEKKTMEAQRRLWDLGIKSAFQNNTLRAGDMIEDGGRGFSNDFTGDSVSDMIEDGGRGFSNDLTGDSVRHDHKCSKVNRLSKWKMKTLSIGGRLTFLKAVLGSMPIYHMSIFKVPMSILQRMESIRCHFFNGIDLNSKKSTWVSWNKVFGVKRERIGRDGKAGHASIWGEKSLKEEYTWLYALEVNKNISVASKFTQETFASSFRRLPRSGVEFEQWRDMLESLDGVLLSQVEDKWKWVLNGSDVFTVASARQYIDNKRLRELPQKLDGLRRFLSKSIFTLGRRV
nr:RNA-directed DNA polymerase, eukaryota, reverse transcriptase zinc-binding domain protein [Tanacetum cinerariifolium]